MIVDILLDFKVCRGFFIRSRRAVVSHIRNGHVVAYFKARIREEVRKFFKRIAVVNAHVYRFVADFNRKNYIPRFYSALGERSVRVDTAYDDVCGCRPRVDVKYLCFERNSEIEIALDVTFIEKFIHHGFNRSARNGKRKPLRGGRFVTRVDDTYKRACLRVEKPSARVSAVYSRVRLNKCHFSFFDGYVSVKRADYSFRYRSAEIT